ncbi:excalibur calcium-binding domain-containing protein [Streptomyces sp. NPDC001728]
METTEDAPEEVCHANCAAVRAAGAAPIHRGDSGYARHLDRDGDGVACEG